MIAEQMLEHLGIRWGYVFLRGAVYLSEEEMRELMNAAVEMYLHDEDERKIVRSEYEGKLSTERRYELLGSFGGQRFQRGTGNRVRQGQRFLSGQRADPQSRPRLFIELTGRPETAVRPICSPKPGLLGSPGPRQSGHAAHRGPPVAHPLGLHGLPLPTVGYGIDL